MSDIVIKSNESECGDTIKLKCCRCKTIKPITEFTKDITSKRGYQYTCNRCRQQYYLVHKQKLKKDRVDYVQTLKGRITVWKARAKCRGIRWNLTIEDLESRPLICFYTGVPLDFMINSPTLVSLDRVDSSGDYTKENVVFCCAHINLMKLDMSVEQFLSVCRKIVEYSASKISL